MKKQSKKSIHSNKSKVNKHQLRILSRMDKTIGGIVSYVFEEEVLEDNGEIVLVETARQNMPLSPKSFTKEIFGKEYIKGYEEVLEMLQNTCNDLGASYFLIN